MKFIYHSEFESITNFLTQKKLSIYTIDGKLELFSCDKISSSSSIFNYIPKEPDTFPSVSNALFTNILANTGANLGNLSFNDLYIMII